MAAVRDTFSLKFTSEGLQDVLKSSEKVRLSYEDWIDSAEESIKKANRLSEEYADNQEKLAEAEALKSKAAKTANRAIAQSYRELGVKSTKSVEDQKNRAVSAFEAIKKSGVASAEDIERAQRALDRRLEQLDAQLDDTAQGMRNLGRESENAGGGFTILKGAIAGTIANLATGLIQKAADGLLNLGRSAIATRTQFSKLRDQIALLEGGELQGEAVFARLQEFNSQTPFELEEVTQAYIKLGNRGIKPTNEQLTKLGDLALSQGKQLDQLVEAVLDAQTGENERLKEFGIRAEKDGDRVKFAFKGITKEVALTEEAVLDALVAFGEVDGIAGNIEKASNRLDGVGSNIADSFSVIQDTIGGIFEPLLVMGGKFLVDILGPIADPKMWAPLGDALNELVMAVGLAVPGADSLAKTFAKGVAGAIELVSAIIFSIADTLREYPGIISSFVDLFGSLSELLSGGVSPTVALILMTLEGWLLILQSIVATLNFAIEGWLLVDDAVKAVGDGVSILATLISTTVQNAILDLKIAWEQVKQFVESVWQSILADWNQTADAIRQQIESFIQWWENVKAKALEVWQSIQQIAIQAIDAVIGKVQALLEPFDKIKTIGSDIGKNILNWENPLKKATNKLNEFKNGFLKILGLSKDVGTDVGEKLEATGGGEGGPLLPAPEGSFSPSRFPVTSGFGMRNGRLHAGVDYGTPQGTPLGNIFGAGTVTIAGPVGAYGNLIELTLDNGDMYRFGHMSRIGVRPGQRVPAGALLGLTGGEPGTPGAGRSTGPHLHLEYYPGGGGPVPFTGGRGGPTLAVPSGSANSIHPFSRHICGPNCKQHGVRKTRGRGGPTAKAKAKKKEDGPQILKVNLSGTETEVELTKNDSPQRIELKAEIKSARDTLDKALTELGIKGESESDRLERQIREDYERIIEALDDAEEKYKTIVAIKDELKQKTEDEKKALKEIEEARKSANEQMEMEIKKATELLKLKKQLQSTLDRANNLENLAGLESQIEGRRTDQAVRSGQLSSFDADRLRIQRRIVEENAAFTSQIARLRLDRAETADEDQILYIDKLIEKYTELNQLSLQDLSTELDEVARAQREAGRILPTTQEIASNVTGTLREIPSLIKDVLSGSRSFGQAVLGLIGSIAERLSGLFLDKGFNALEGIIGGLFGGGSQKKSGGGFLGTLLKTGIGAAASGLTGGASGATSALLPGASPIFAARGGLVIGRGTSTSDSINARLSNREYVVNAGAVRAVGVRSLDYINSRGSLPSGGMSGGNTVVFNVTAEDAGSFRKTERQMHSAAMAEIQRFQ